MKIDCSITENYLKEKARMTDSCNIDCAVCELLNLCRTSKADIKYDIEIVKVVQKWSDAHLQKTYLEDFKEKYPKAKLSTCGIPYDLCPDRIGYEEKSECFDGYGRCTKCWNQIMEDQK